MDRRKFNGGKRKGAGKPKGKPSTLINFRIDVKKKEDLKRKIKKPQKAFKIWVNFMIDDAQSEKYMKPEDFLIGQDNPKELRLSNINPKKPKK